MERSSADSSGSNTDSAEVQTDSAEVQTDSSGAKIDTAGPSVDPPIRGEWKAIHNPGDTPHALDFVGLRSGRRLPYPRRTALPHVFYRAPAAAAFGWDRPVYAPFEGAVIEAGDGHPDAVEMNLVRDVLQNVVLSPELDGNVRRFAGNYVAIEGTESVAFLAHLRCGSVTVRTGDVVTAGERIGSVGNSGASLVPHLHFQLLREWPRNVARIADADRPFRFRRYDRWTDGAWRSVRDRGPESGDRIRIPARGECVDPCESR